MIWGLDPQALQGPPASTRTQQLSDDHNPTAKNIGSRQAAPRIFQEQPLSAINSPNSELCILDTGDSDSVDAVFKRESAMEDMNKSVHRDNFPTDNGSQKTHFKPSALKNSYITKRHLRSSAPIFIPTVSDNVLPGNAMESCTSQNINLKPRTLVALDIARQYCLDQKNNALPTPPTSSAPQWSPVLSGYAFGRANEWKLPRDQQRFLEFVSAATAAASETDPGEDQIIDQSSAIYNLGLRHLASDWTRLHSLPERPSQTANEKSCSGRLPNTPSLRSDSVATSFGIVNRRISAPYSHPKHQRTAVTERSSSRTVLSATQSKQDICTDPAGCVQLSASRYPPSGFNNFHTKNPRFAELSLGPDPTPTHNVFLRKMKPAMEPTPTVKLPLTATKFSDGAEEMKTHGDYGKENISNPKVTNPILQKRGRIRKRNTKPDNNQDKLSRSQVSTDAWL